MKKRNQKITSLVISSSLILPHISSTVEVLAASDSFDSSTETNINSVSIHGVKDIEICKGDIIDLYDGISISSSADNSTDSKLDITIKAPDGTLAKEFNSNIVGKWVVTYKAILNDKKVLKSATINVVDKPSNKDKESIKTKEENIETTNNTTLNIDDIKEYSTDDISEISDIAVESVSLGEAVKSDNYYTFPNAKVETTQEIHGFKIDIETDDLFMVDYILDGKELSTVNKTITFYEEYTSEQVKEILQNIKIYSYSNSDVDVRLLLMIEDYLPLHL